MMRIGNVGLMLALGIHPSDLEDAWLDAEDGVRADAIAEAEEEGEDSEDD